MVTTLSDSVVVTDSAPLITADYTGILNSLHELKFSTTADSIESASILEEYYAVVKVDDQFKEFVINDIRESDESDLIKEVTASLSSVELADSLVENKITGTSASVLLRNILNGTRWTVGTVESGIYSRQFTEDVQFMTVLEAVFALQTAFNCDVNFSYVVEGSKVVSRRVNLYARLGASDGKRFEIDKDVTSLERRVDTTQIATAIYPIRREEVDGKEVITDISSLVWTTADGKPVNKPAGQKIISDPVALQNWGRIGADGKLYDRVKLYEFNEDVSLEQMAQMSWINLGRYTSPKITYTAKVVDLYALLGSDYAHEKIVLGDDAVVIDRHFANPVVTESRVIEYHRDLLDPTENEVILGFSVRDYASSRSNTSKAIQDAVDIATQARLNASSAIASANGKNTNFFGSVRPVNPRTGDLWFRPNPDNTEQQQLLYWDGVQWIIELDTATFVFPEEEIEALRQAVAEAKKAGEDAIVAGEEAKQAAEEVSDKVAQLETEVAQAVTDADSALTKANEATDKAESALSEAELSRQKAEQASQDAFNSEQLANSAKQDAINAQGTASSAKTTADKAIIDAQKALDDLDNLEIGGRNLLLDSSSEWANYDFLGYYNQTVRFELKELNLKPTDDVYISGVYQNVSGNSIRISIVFYTENSVQLSAIIGNEIAVGDTGISSNLGKIPSNASYALLRLASTGVSTGRNIGKYKEIFFTKSSKPMPWQPAPEDVQVQLTTINNELTSKVSQTTFNTLDGKVNTQQTQITQNKTDITSKADKSEVNTLKGTVETQGTKINQNAEEIEQRASKTEVNTLTGRVNNTETTVSTQAGQITVLNTKTDGNTTQIGKLQSDYTGLSSTVSKVETDFNTLGNINLLQNGTNENSKERIADGTTSGSFQDYRHVTLLLPNNLIVGESYTLSFLPEKLAGEFTNYTVREFTTGKTVSALYESGKRYIFTFNKSSNSNSILVYAGIMGQTIGNKLALKDIMINKGSKALEYFPTQSEFTSKTEFSSFQQTVNGFQTTVNSDISGIKSQQTQMAVQISSKVEKSEFNTLSGTVSSQQSQITQLSDQITSTVDKVDTVEGTVNTQKTQITQLSDTIILKADKSEVDTLKGTVNTQGTQIAQNTQGIQLKADKTEVSALDGKVTGQQSQITLMADQLTSTVSQLGDITKRKNLLPFMESGEGKTSDGTVIPSTTRGISPFVPYDPAKSYILSVNGSASSSSYYYYYDSSKQYLSYRNNSTGLVPAVTGAAFIRVEKGNFSTANKYMLEEGTVVTAYAPYISDVSQSQITQLSDSISLSVKKDGLLGEINLQAGKTLIRQGDNVLMVTPETTFIQNATIKTAAIEDAAITTAKIGNLAVNTAQIADLAVGTAQLKDAVITNAKIGDLAVDNAKIANGAINAVKIQDASITSAKIMNLDVDKLSGNTSNFVQSSWNSLSQGVSITASGLEFTRDGILTSTLDGNGQNFYSGSRYIGRTGITSKTGEPNVQGITHNLYNQGDFISWGYQTSAASSNLTALLTLDPKGTFNPSGYKGLIVGTESFFNKVTTFKPSGGSGSIKIENDANYTKINYYFNDSLRSAIRFLSSGSIVVTNYVTNNSATLIT